MGLRSIVPDTGTQVMHKQHAALVGNAAAGSPIGDLWDTHIHAGDQFALFEAVVALAMLVRRYDFRLDPAAPPVGMTTGATIHTSAGLHMFLTPRTHPEQQVCFIPPCKTSIVSWESCMFG